VHARSALVSLAQLDRERLAAGIDAELDALRPSLPQFRATSPRRKNAT
jgi:hypothetical protein